MADIPKLKYIVHFRETPDSPQWDEVFDTKAEADKKALSIFLNGGISVTVTEEVEDED